MHHSEFFIREAQARDLDAMVELLRQLFAIEDDFVFDERKQRHGLAALMADHGRSIIKIVELHRIVVGMCSAQITISTAEGGMSALIEDLVIEKMHRGRGIGTALLKEVAAWAEDHQCVRLQLLADSRNTPALEFYSGAGWHRTTMVCLNKRTGVQCGVAFAPRHETLTTRR